MSALSYEAKFKANFYSFQSVTPSEERSPTFGKETN